MSEQEHIGVLIVEDSLVTRRFLADLIDNEPDLYVAGQASDGAEAVDLARRLRPDVISMDVSMPAMDGLEATRHIMADHPTPIVVVSASLKKQDIDLAFEALQAGALAAVEKPPGPAHPDFDAKRSEMITALRLMARVKVVKRRGTRPPGTPTVEPVVPEQTMPAGDGTRRAPEIVAIGASAGGPAALAQLLGGLPADFPLPVLVVQHLADDFLPGLAEWLDQTCSLEVRLAREGESLYPGTVYIAPGSAHMTVNGSGQVKLVRARGEHRHQPSATVLMESVARSYGEAAIGVILTGMGDDGVAGLRAMRDAEARTLAQDEKSCVVFGMPGAAVACGAVEHIVPLDRIAAAIQELL